jgi:hypothetical protein
MSSENFNEISSYLTQSNQESSFLLNESSTDFLHVSTVQNANEQLENGEIAKENHTNNNETQYQPDPLVSHNVSQNSNQISNAQLNSNPSSSLFMCRICHCDDINLMTACNCKGSIAYVHQDCLQKWLRINGNKSCELCKYNFIMKKNLKPIKRWKNINLTKESKRKILFDMLVYILAIISNIWTIVIFSEIIIKRLKYKHIDWVLFMVLVLCSICWIGMIWFAYFFLNLNYNLIKKWIDFNRDIEILPNVIV